MFLVLALATRSVDLAEALVLALEMILMIFASLVLPFSLMLWTLTLMVGGSFEVMVWRVGMLHATASSSGPSSPRLRTVFNAFP